MKIVFEKDGWQIISYGPNKVHTIHADCAAYNLLSGLKDGCRVCTMTAPEGIKALVALYNWGHE